jgi:thioredoxin-like negative regulator of GroEL
LILFRHGQPVEKHTGTQPAKKLEIMLEKHL